MLALFFGGMGPMEMMVIGVIAVLLFGSKLPSVARSAGKSLTEFRRGMQDLQHDFNDAMRESEAAVATAAEGTQARLPDTTTRDDALGDEAYDIPYEEELAANDGSQTDFGEDTRSARG